MIVLFQKIFRCLAILSLLLFCAVNVFAQCNASDNTPISITGLTVTDVNCPQNGSITVNGTAGGGGGDYVYEIYDGPVIRGIQSQHVFAALLPGNYKVRVTGCNGTFVDATANVGNSYLQIDEPHTLTFLKGQSFKCNVTNDGKVNLKQILYLPNNLFSDTQYYRLPFRYQVSTSNDPVTGFAASPYKEFTGTSFVTYSGVTREVQKSATISGLSAGTTYYVKVTDQCGVFNTESITLPTVSAPVLTYDFQVKEPYALGFGGLDVLQVKGNCVQWGELTVFVNGIPASSLASNNTLLPITAVLKRQEDGSVISTRQYNSDSLQKYTYANSNNANNLIFDSVPRVPVVLELTDACGTVTTINANTPSVKVPFKLQVAEHCSTPASFYINTVNAALSYPLRMKIYNSSNTLIVNKLMNYSYHYVFLSGPDTPNYCCNQQSVVPALGQYCIVYEDQCGSDSLVFNFTGTPGAYVAPAFNFNPYPVGCISLDGISRYKVDALQTNVSPVSSITITSGPAGLNYPISRKYSNVPTEVSYSMSSSSKYYFDSLITGTYQVLIKYGCNQQLNTSFTISGGTLGNYTASLSFDISSNTCSSSGATVLGTAVITSSDKMFVVNDLPLVRFTAAPLPFLTSISRTKNGGNPSLPLDLGLLSATSTYYNGIDTNLVNIYPLYSYYNLMNDYFTFPPGNYTVQIYGKCSGSIYETKSFTVTASAYSNPTLGASSGYICMGGEVKVVASPIGGKRPFQYQIKLASDPDESHYSALQTDSIFTLPGTTPPGTIFNLRAVDACNNSFTGQVVVNSFTGNLYLAVSDDCLGAPSKIITGYIPGGIYTWTKPDGSIVISNSNEINIPSFSVADIGIYTVVVNAMDGCISKGTGFLVGSKCYTVLPLDIIQFTATKKGLNQVLLKWETAGEIPGHLYEAERSADGINWLKIGEQRANQKGGATTQRYTYLDTVSEINKSPVMFYRIKQVSTNGRINYTKVEKVYFATEFSLLKVYPTPFVTAVNIDFMAESTESAVVSLYNMAGNEVSRSVMPVNKGVNHYQYSPVLPVEAGNYLLVLYQGNKKLSQIVIKMPSGN